MSRGAVNPATGKRATKLRKPERSLDELKAAPTLRASEVFRLYGIPANTVQQYALAGQFESILIQGRKGRKGVRLIDHTAFKAWLDEHRVGKKAA